MGQRLMRRAPKYVHSFIDRHGQPLFHFGVVASKKYRYQVCRGRQISWGLTRRR